MADVIELIRGRRSIRKYQNREISEEQLTAVLEAVRWAPSWTNSQCWEVIVIKDPAIKKAIQGVLPPPSVNPSSNAIVEAPVVIAICGKLGKSGYYKGEVATKLGDWFMFDLGIAAQNLCLTAHYLNLGTVIVGLFDQEKVKEILKVPEGFELVALIPLGYPAQEAKTRPRKEISEFVHYDTF
jgi:nitroreductase